MSSISIVTNEKQLIRCLIEQPSLIVQIEEDLFLSEPGSALYKTIGELFVKSVPLTKEHLLSEGNRHSSYVTSELIEQLWNQEFDLESFSSYYLPRIRKDFAKQEIQNIISGELKVLAESKGELDVEALQGHITVINQHIAMTEPKQNILYSASQAAAEYANSILSRESGSRVWRSGCSYLDKYLTVGMPPKTITTLFGATGAGKSAFALYLESRKINRRLPSVYVSLEMDLISTFDRLCAMRKRIDMRLLYPHDGSIQEHVMNKVLEEIESLKRVKSFWFVEETGLCKEDIRAIARDAKRYMGVDSLNITIDLFTMLKEFSGKDAADYEDGVNQYFELAKEENIHMTWVVQANRKADSTRITAIDQLDWLRPTRNTVKNSGAIMERSRLGLGIFRPKFYAEMLFPDHPELENMEDILEIQILKQNQGETSEILKYKFEAPSFSISEWREANPPSVLSSVVNTIT